MTRKGCSKPFASLPEKTPDKVALECLKQRLELSDQSLIGSHLIKRFNEVMHQHDQEHNLLRIGSGELLVEYRGEHITLPMLPKEGLDELANKGSLTEFFEHRELEQYAKLQDVCSDTTPADLRKVTSKPVKGRIPKDTRPYRKDETAIERTDRLSDMPIPSPESLGVATQKRQLETSRDVPSDVVKTLQNEFAEGFSLRASMVEAVCQSLGAIHQWMHPLVDEVQPGQVVWMARSLECPRDWAGQAHGMKYTPVILTHHKPQECPSPHTQPVDFFAMEQTRAARMTVEAYVQGAALSTQDLCLLLSRNPSHVRRVLDTYQEATGLLLPTTGTMLDMGSTLTHKKMAVELFLQGHNTSHIARRLFHTEQAIDNYLTTFNKVAMLYVLVTSDSRFIAQITSLSQRLVQEHLSLIRSYLPERSQLIKHLNEQGVELPQPISG